jgi:hypothetical protein
VALYRLAISLCCGLTLITGCSNEKPAGQSLARPVVEALPATKATADVDPRATLALKQSLLTNFPQNSPGSAVEAGLIKDEFDCGPNPTAPAERACLKAERKGACEINTIVRTLPYAPEKAQVIKICEVGDAAPQSN